MMPNPADKIALKALTKPTEKALKDKAIGALRNEEHLEAFNLAFRLYLHQTPKTVPVAELSGLIRARLFQSAEFLFLKHGKDIETLSIDECLVAAATTKCLNQWVGKGTCEKERIASLLERFQSSPSEAMCNVLAKWFFEYAPADLVPKAVSTFGFERSDKYYTSTAELFKKAIERDKQGKFLTSFLTFASSTPRIQEDFLKEAKSDHTLLDLIIPLFPHALNPNTVETIASLLPMLFADLTSNEGDGRKRRSSAQLLQLASLLMAQPWTVESDRVLTELDRISRKPLDSLPNGTITRDVTTINYLGVVRPEAETHVTPFGAQLIASAIDGLRRDNSPTMTIEVAAFNLGMREIGEVGQSVSFNPTLHCDVVGGAIEGDKVIVQTSGWQLEGQIIERANVKPT